MYIIIYILYIIYYKYNHYVYRFIHKATSSTVVLKVNVKKYKGETFVTPFLEMGGYITS